MPPRPGLWERNYPLRTARKKAISKFYSIFKQATLRGLNQPSPAKIPVIGNRNAIVLLVDFNDNVSTLTPPILLTCFFRLIHLIPIV